MARPISEFLAGLEEKRSFRDFLAAAGDDRAAWTGIAAAAFTGGGFLAAVVGTTVLLGLAGFVTSPNSIGSLDLETIGGVILWFVAPTIGATVTGTPAWGLLVEVLGTRLVAADEDRSRLAYPGLGGLAGAVSGALAHVVMWVIIMVVVNLYDTLTGTPTEGLVEAIGIGLFIGVLSIGFTGIISVPILGATGLGLGYARRRVSSDDGTAAPEDGGRETDAEDGNDREDDGSEDDDSENRDVPEWNRLEDTSGST